MRALAGDSSAADARETGVVASMALMALHVVLSAAKAQRSHSAQIRHTVVRLFISAAAAALLPALESALRTGSSGSASAGVQLLSGAFSFLVVHDFLFPMSVACAVDYRRRFQWMKGTSALIGDGLPEVDAAPTDSNKSVRVGPCQPHVTIDFRYSQNIASYATLYGCIKQLAPAYNARVQIFFSISAALLAALITLVLAELFRSARPSVALVSACGAYLFACTAPLVFAVVYGWRANSFSRGHACALHAACQRARAAALLQRCHREGPAGDVVRPFAREAAGVPSRAEPARSHSAASGAAEAHSSAVGVWALSGGAVAVGHRRQAIWQHSLDSAVGLCELFDSLHPAALLGFPMSLKFLAVVIGNLFAAIASIFGQSLLQEFEF